MVCRLHVCRKARKAREEHHEVVIQLLLTIGGNDDWLYVKAVRVEIDAVESAIRRRDLILPTACLIAKHALKIDRLFRQSALIDVFAL